MKRMHLNKKIKISFINKFIVLLFVITFIVIYLFIKIANTVTPLLIDCAVIYAKKTSNKIISQAIKEVNCDIDSLYTLKKDNEIIKEANFNTININNYLADLNLNINKKLEKYNSKIVYKVPLKLIYNNPFISNLGSEIPIKINFINSISSNIKTKINNYGINNAVIEIYAQVTLEEAVIIPFKTKNIKVNMNVPLLIKIINGNIPNYYSGIDGASSKFTIPITE